MINRNTSYLLILIEVESQALNLELKIEMFTFAANQN